MTGSLLSALCFIAFIHMKPKPLLVQLLPGPCEGIHEASYKSRLLLLLQAQCNLFDRSLQLCVISQIILLSKSQLYGLICIVAAVNTACSLGLIHAWRCFILSGSAGPVCDILLVCTSQIIPQSQYQLCHLPRVMFQVHAESGFLLSDIIFKPEVDKAGA